MMTVCFIGDPNPHYSSFNWMINAHELGYFSKLNDLSGLTRKDVIIVDKYTGIDFSSSPATKILYFPDVVGSGLIRGRYLRNRTNLLMRMAPMVDLIVMPPNEDLIKYARRVTNKPVFKMLFGAYTRYFDFIPSAFPKKSIERGFCWSLGSKRRDKLITRYGLVQITGFGHEMISGLSKCLYAFNAHFTSIPNNEQRLTEIPLAMTIPVSEPLGDSRQLSELFIVPLTKIDKSVIESEQYRSIANTNLKAVVNKYNSRESLRLILSHLRSQ
jgi:hypothetical protein